MEKTRSRAAGQRPGTLSGVQVGVYHDSSCGLCGYGLDKGEYECVALISSPGVRDGEGLCFRCFAEAVGDRLSATHRVQ